MAVNSKEPPLGASLRWAVGYLKVPPCLRVGSLWLRTLALSLIGRQSVLRSLEALASCMEKRIPDPFPERFMGSASPGSVCWLRRMDLDI